VPIGRHLRVGSELARVVREPFSIGS
jgi:hypothetical protein